MSNGQNEGNRREISIYTMSQDGWDGEQKKVKNPHRLLKLAFDEEYVYNKEMEQSLESREKFGDNFEIVIRPIILSASNFD